MIASLLPFLLLQASPAETSKPLPIETKKGRVCKPVRITGTRLRDRKVCMSAREWQEIEREAQEAQRDLADTSKMGRAD